MQTATIQVRWPEKFGEALVHINASDFDPAIHRGPNDEKETQETAQTEGPLPVIPAEPAIATPAEELAAIETTILALHKEGKNSREIGAHVGWAWQKVTAVLKRYGQV